MYPPRNNKRLVDFDDGKPVCLDGQIVRIETVDSPTEHGKLLPHEVEPKPIVLRDSIYVVKYDGPESKHVRARAQRHWYAEQCNDFNVELSALCEDYEDIERHDIAGQLQQLAKEYERK